MIIKGWSRQFRGLDNLFYSNVIERTLFSKQCRGLNKAFFAGAFSFKGVLPCHQSQPISYYAGKITIPYSSYVKYSKVGRKMSRGISRHDIIYLYTSFERPPGQYELYVLRVSNVT